MFSMSLNCLEIHFHHFIFYKSISLGHLGNSLSSTGLQGLRTLTLPAALESSHILCAAASLASSHSSSFPRGALQTLFPLPGMLLPCWSSPWIYFPLIFQGSAHTSVSQRSRLVSFPLLTGSLYAFLAPGSS